MNNFLNLPISALTITLKEYKNKDPNNTYVIYYDINSKKYLFGRDTYTCKDDGLFDVKPYREFKGWVLTNGSFHEKDLHITVLNFGFFELCLLHKPVNDLYELFKNKNNRNHFPLMIKEIIETLEFSKNFSEPKNFEAPNTYYENKHSAKNEQIKRSTYRRTYNNDSDLPF